MLRKAVFEVLTDWFNLKPNVSRTREFCFYVLQLKFDVDTLNLILISRNSDTVVQKYTQYVRKKL